MAEKQARQVYNEYLKTYKKKKIKDGKKHMSTESESRNMIARICPDFYPNCKYCTCFHLCFPDNEKDDKLSKSVEKE